MGTLAFERGALDARPADRFENELARDHRRGAARNGARRRPGDPPAPRRRLDRRCGSCATTRCARSPRSSAAPTLSREALITKLYWATLAPRPRRAGDGRARRPTREIARRARRYELTAPAAHCSCSPGPTRSTAAPTRSSATSSASGRSACRASRKVARRRRRGLPMPAPVPPYPPATRLLAGKTVARHRRRRHRHRLRRPRSAAPRRARRVVISDIHERRLGEAADAARRRSPARRPPTVLCDVTVEDAGAGAGRRRGRRARPHRRAGQQRRPRRHAPTSST